MPRYEFTEGSSNKFWDITLDGKSFSTTYGKIGAKGQTTIKSYKNPAEAKAEYEKLIAEKVKKGYQLAGSEKAASAATNGKRYLESGDKFWEVFVDGKSVKTRFGKIGSQGQMRLKEFKSAADAEADLEGQLAKKVKEGFAEAAPAPAKSKPAAAAKSNPDLEKAILANPDDADAYMVYADWLQGQGDPRGELIALQSAKKKQATQFFEEHIDDFLGTLKEHQACYDGFSYRRGKDDDKTKAFTWKNGFIYAARFAHNQYATEWKGKLATDVVEPLLKHPSGKFLVEMTINENDDPSEDTLDDIFAVIAKHPIPTLRKLTIGDDVSQISWYRIGNVGKIWKALPNLEWLEIEAGEFALGTIEAPKLKHAVFKTGGLSKGAMKSIAAAKWPNIEHLEVYFGDDNYGADSTVKDVMPLLDRTDLRKLKYLAVKNAEFQNELVVACAKSKLVKQLDTLDFSEGILTDDCIADFEKHADAFEHLTLNVSETYLSDEVVKRLKKIPKKLIAEDMREDDDPEYRYVGVGE